MASGISSAAGALSNPMLEQLTTQDCWGPSGQLQLTGQGLQLLPPSACAAEPHTSKQQSATSRLEKKLNLGRQTPCFRLDKVCPFPQGIAHSHLIASDGVSPHSLGRNKSKNTRVLFPRLSYKETKTEEVINFFTPLSVFVFPALFFFSSYPLPLKM